MGQGRKGGGCRVGEGLCKHFSKPVTLTVTTVDGEWGAREGEKGGQG